MSHLDLELKLQEFSVEEKLVLDILTHVNVTRRECEIVSVQTWSSSVQRTGNPRQPRDLLLSIIRFWICRFSFEHIIQNFCSFFKYLPWSWGFCLSYLPYVSSVSAHFWTFSTAECWGRRLIAGGRTASYQKCACCWDSADWSRTAFLCVNSVLGYLLLCCIFLWQELEYMDFDEKKEINKRKQMILEGKVRVAAVYTILISSWYNAHDMEKKWQLLPHCCVASASPLLFGVVKFILKDNWYWKVCWSSVWLQQPP